jgi:hypothetical protein
LGQEKGEKMNHSDFKRALQKNRLLKYLFLIILICGGSLILPSIPDFNTWGKEIYRARKGQRNYQFNGTISREVLESYLSRAITFSSLLDRNLIEGYAQGNTDDNIRMINNIGAKFIGRTIFTWNGEHHVVEILEDAKEIAARIHSIDPEIILQAAFFETVSIQVESISLPSWIFKEFGLITENRNFSLAAMYEEGGPHENFWGNNTAVPDMGKLETRMWTYFLCVSYIDIGIEAIHFGQIALMADNDPTLKGWNEILQRVRNYAKENARRHMVICDAHVPNGGYTYNGKLLFDFHSFPQCPEEIPCEPQKAKLVLGYRDSIYRKSKGGITPSGWVCDSLPYLIELDNAGMSDHPGENVGGMWIWGYDEITWFAHQSEAYRNEYLWYTVDWLEKLDPNGFLQMPGCRLLAESINGVRYYFANTPSDNITNGYNQENTIKNIWNHMPNFYLDCIP